jgi:hypothetical protein
MKTAKTLLKAGAAVALVAIMLMLLMPQAAVQAQQVGSQVLISMKFIKAGVGSQGAGVLQTGEVNNLSAAVASGTTAQVVAAPASGSIYLRGLWVEKMTTATGSINVIYGTGTNCGTGTTTLLSMSMAASQIPTVGEYKLGVLVPATKALCLQTDAATTSVRALTN